jgi:DNA-binding response OmpR family regulator
VNDNVATLNCGRVLIVDDDPEYRELVRALLEGCGLDVRLAASGEQALHAAREEPPHLVLLDVVLRDTSGYEVCHQLRELHGDRVAIVFVSGQRTEAYDRIGGLMIGADDYIVKPFDPGELIARVRAHLRRTQSSQRRTDDDPFATLTTREREVLISLALGQCQDDIAREFVISPKTVATHIQRILVKLGVHSRAEAVAYAHREGLVDAVEAHIADASAV